MAPVPWQCNSIHLHPHTPPCLYLACKTSSLVILSSLLQHLSSRSSDIDLPRAVRERAVCNLLRRAVDSVCDSSNPIDCTNHRKHSLPAVKRLVDVRRNRHTSPSVNRDRESKTQRERQRHRESERMRQIVYQ